MTLDSVLLALSGPLPGEASRAAMLPGFRRYPPVGTCAGQWREAAVLILLYEDGGTARFPLMLRPSGDGVHAGQVSLPGGSREADESLEACALREAREEMGVVPSTVRVVRALSPLAVPPSRFVVHPFVGVAAERPRFSPAAAEVTALYEPSLDELMDAASRCEDEAEYAGQLWRVPFYRLAGLRVWGATAMILSELEAMLEGGGTIQRDGPA